MCRTWNICALSTAEPKGAQLRASRHSGSAGAGPAGPPQGTCISIPRRIVQTMLNRDQYHPLDCVGHLQRGGELSHRTVGVWFCREANAHRGDPEPLQGKQPGSGGKFRLFFTCAFSLPSDANQRLFKGCKTQHLYNLNPAHVCHFIRIFLGRGICFFGK